MLSIATLKDDTAFSIYPLGINAISKDSIVKIIYLLASFYYTYFIILDFLNNLIKSNQSVINHIKIIINDYQDKSIK